MTQPESRWERAAINQGFEEPFGESPIDTPDGWHDGSLHQTGGFIMVRTWRTWDGASTEKRRDVEFECNYGDNDGVSIVRQVWDNENEYYEWGGEVETVTVDENTDAAKAEAAKSLMENFSRPDE